MDKQTDKHIDLDVSILIQNMGKYKILIILGPFFTIENSVSISANA